MGRAGNQNDMPENDEKTLAEALREMPWAAILVPLVLSLLSMVAACVAVMNQ